MPRTRKSGVSKERGYPLTAPLYFVKNSEGAPVLRLAEGVEWAIDPEECQRRFESEPVRCFLEEYQKAGGDPRLMCSLLLALLPIKAKEPPSLQELQQLQQKIEKAMQVLSEIVYLPGCVYQRKLYEDAFFALGAFRQPKAIEMYLAQFTPEQSKPFVVQDYDPELFRDPDSGDLLYPPTGAPRRGRPQRGSPVGLVLGVLAKECRRRFETSRWDDIRAVVCAVAPETFSPDLRSVEHLQKRAGYAARRMLELLPEGRTRVRRKPVAPTDIVLRSEKTLVEQLHEWLFPPDNF